MVRAVGDEALAQAGAEVVSVPAWSVFPIPPLCQSNGSRCRFAAAERRGDRHADVVLVAPDGKPNPGGWYCRPHGEAIVDEYLRVLGEVWTLVPIVRSADA